MVTETMEITIYAPWVHSLKEKRMELRSLMGRVRSRFGVSIAEVDTMDVHQTLTIGVACVSGEAAPAQQVLDQVLRFIESSTEGEVTRVVRQTL